MKEKFVITRLDQLKALSESLRVRLLDALVATDATVAELAKRLGEPAGKLYHHVDLLLETGLIEVVGRKQKRGTEERTFRAVAKDYTVQDSIFGFETSGRGGIEALVDLARSTFQGLADELAAAARTGRLDPQNPGKRVFLETQELQLTEDDFVALCATLDRWIDDAKGRSQARARKKLKYRFGVGFFPLALALGLVGGLPGPAGGQTARERAARLITAADVRHTVGVIAHDSMLGRSTPSRELDLTAGYLAGRLRAAGVRPLGSDGSYLQTYPVIRERLAVDQSTVELAGSGKNVRLTLGSRLAFAQGTIPARPIEAALTLLGGTIEPGEVVADSVRGRVVLWLVDVTGPGAASIDGVAAALLAGGPAAVLLVPNDTTLTRGAAALQGQERISRPAGAEAGGFTALAADQGVLSDAWPGLDSVFRRLRSSPKPVFLSTEIRARLSLAREKIADASAPNVVGVIPGTDPASSSEYLVISAHMDHIGVSPGAAADSINNGADDNASGTAAVLEVARAMATAGVRPRRSVIFAIVSGEERGLWGSEHFVRNPPVPLGSIVANINLDMVGRNWRDTVGVIGRGHSNLGAILDQVAARHSGLRVIPVDDRWPDQNRFYRSDHYNFARSGVPSLFLSSGYAPEYHQPGDSPEKIDAEKLARLAKLVFYFALEVADRADRPAWVEASRRKIAR